MIFQGLLLLLLLLGHVYLLLLCLFMYIISVFNNNLRPPSACEEIITINFLFVLKEPLMQLYWKPQIEVKIIFARTLR